MSRFFSLALLLSLSLATITGCSNNSNPLDPNSSTTGTGNASGSNNSSGSNSSSGSNNASGSSKTFTGNNGFIVNGDGHNNVVFNSSLSTAYLSWSATTISMAGYCEGMTANLGMNIPGRGVGTYYWDGQGDNFLSISVGNDGYISYKGVTRITSISLHNIKGTFSGTAVNLYDGSKMVTIDGRFDIPM